MIERIAFVSADGGSAFMAELLDVVADSVESCGLAVVRHRGLIEEVDDGRTAFVVVPHEYFAVAGAPPRPVLPRTVGFCVEHPGTATFESSIAAASTLAARFDINSDARAESHRRGVCSESYQLGYSARWDRRADVATRDIDVVYLGTADPRRLRILAQLARPMQRLHTELLMPPHEPMTRPRPDFLLGDAKWRLLARSRILLNLHRESSTAFEWVRALEAMCNGTVVVSEPTSDLSPFVAGEQLLVARPDRLAGVVRAALEDPELLAGIAAAALDAARSRLDPLDSARRLGDLALSLPEGIGQPAASRRPARRSDPHPPMAQWVPTPRLLPMAAAPPPAPFLEQLLDQVHDLARPGIPLYRPDDRAGTVEVDVICVSAAGDGPVSLTLDSLPAGAIAVHLAFDGTAAAPLERWGAVRSVITSPVAIGRARSRNALLELGTAPLVLVVDAGDQLLDGTLDQLRARLRPSARADIALCLAQFGTDQLVNLFEPELRRLQLFSYLTRGYLVRRSWLERIGGFAEARPLQELGDHDFWCRSAALAANVVHQRRIGMALWQRAAQAGQADREHGAVALLAERVEAALRESTTATTPAPTVTTGPPR